MKVYPKRVNLRYEPPFDGEGEGTWLLRCDECASSGGTTAYWPLGLQWWMPDKGMQRCRGCHQTRNRHKYSQEEQMARRRAYQKRYYRAHRAERRIYARSHYAANADAINETRRTQRQAKLKEQDARAA